MTKEELYKVTDILNDVLSNYLRGSEAEEVIAKLEESVEDSELIKEEPVSEASLEEAAEMFIDSLIPTEVDTVTPFAAEYVIELLNRAIKFGANWQKSKYAKLIINAKDDGYRLGLATMKQQMLAKAVDAVVKIDAGGYPYVDRTIELYDYDKDIPLAKRGDKVKVLVIKEG